ncbi:hypothetical protein QFC22_001443 [Naganishia vaughanmartiniae]|uniref:Uncharacterized protein n=1 Tax=Naganishia vaughanmartiniae TaxID=1424756 RepID=A0ACC2XH25_9TREE|nr:hypothetical protein QFC22_001443 [Naganishia vaughanmartiniae]
MDQTAYCTRFAEILQAHKTAHASAEQAIDEQHGLATQWREATLSEFNREGNADLQQAYWLQAQTWHILAVLSEQRLGSHETEITPEELVKQNPHVLPAKLVDCIIDNDTQLREWIESPCPSIWIPIFVEKGFAAQGAGCGQMLRKGRMLFQRYILHSGEEISLKQKSCARKAEKPGGLQAYAAADIGAIPVLKRVTLSKGEPVGSPDASDVQLQGNLHRALWKKACLANANNVRTTVTQSHPFGI